jgi:flagellar motor protein MotB
MKTTGDDGFLHSQADLMAGVAGIFFVLLAVLLAQAHARARKAEAEKTAVVDVAKERQEAADYVRDTLAVLAEKLGQRTTERVTTSQRDDILDIDIDPDRDIFVFELGQDRLAPAREPRALSVLQGVLSTVCEVVENRDRGPVPIQRIVLEGHTDNQGYGACGTGNAASCLFGENVALSGRRAVNALRLVYERSNDDALRGCIERRFLITGRGPVDPVDAAGWREAQSPEQRRINRRVVLRVEGRRDLDTLVLERRGKR